MKDNIFSIGVLYQLPQPTCSLMSDHATPNVSFVCMIITSGTHKHPLAAIYINIFEMDRFFSFSVK